MPDNSYISDMHGQMLALHKVSEALLVALRQDLAAIDAEAIQNQLQQREQIIAALAQVPAEARKAFQATQPELVASTQRVGEQCIETLQTQGFALNETQRQMTHGRHLLQTYQPEAEQESRFIEGDA